MSFVIYCRVKLPPVATSLTTQEAIPLSALPKDTTIELAGLSPHYNPFKYWTLSREAVNTNF